MNIQDLLKLERIKLSSGQLRKILLLKIILLQPQFLLLDNAHLGLDHQSRQVLNDYIDLLVSQDNQQIIMSGHFRSLPKCITHVLHLEKGQINGIQSVGEYMANKQAINAAPELPVSIPNYFSRPVNEPFKRVLHFADISIKYKNTSVLEKLNWTVKKGEKWTLQGPNGVGKSTLISLIYADHPQAYSNKIQLFDKARGSGESIWDIKKRIGFSSPELHSFFNFNFETLSVILSGLYDTFYLGKYSDEQRQAAESLLQYFDISEHLYAPFHNLSTGTQRVILLLRALIKRPPVLLLDEPYQGLDQDTIHQCNHLLCEILTEQHTLIFISHFDDEVPAIIKKQLILN
ncbi:MAG: ATP-binding cassette domain-containing protein [Saprospiraceae bacterium]|nr:ATP-binding cassette domain-containing protein [Saprospiraceae bacterium]